MSPAISWGLNTWKPSLVLPPLAKISATASVQIDSDINGDANSFIDVNVPATKSSMIPSSSVLPSATEFITVCIGLSNVSYALAWLKSTYWKEPSLFFIGNKVEFFDQSATYLLIASLSSSVTSYIAWKAFCVAYGTAATVAPKPNNLVCPIPANGFITVPSGVTNSSFISLRPRLTIFVPVLTISAGKDTKLPIGNFLNDLTKSDT